MTRRLVACSLSVFVAACSSTKPDIGDDIAALSALSPAELAKTLELVGSLTYGQTSMPVADSAPPRYRGFTFVGAKGDAVDAWIRSQDGDAVGWLVDGSFKSLAENDDADANTTDSHLSASLPSDGIYTIVFREFNLNPADFIVSLNGAPRVHDGGTDLANPDLASPINDGGVEPDLVAANDLGQPDLATPSDLAPSDPRADDMVSADGADKSLTWTAQNSNANFFIEGIWGSSATDVYAVGAGMVHSANRGQTWTVQGGNGVPSGFRVWGSSSADVYASGAAGAIFHSTNQGQTWSSQSNGVPKNVILWSVWGSSANDVYVAAGASILHSTNQGQTWTDQAANGVPCGYTVWGSAADDVYILGCGSTIFGSTNQGQTWADRGANGVVQNVALYDMWGSSADDVYIVGDFAMILHSTDRGKTWTEQYYGIHDPLYAIWGSGADDVYAVGGFGTIIHSSDRGQTWTAQASGTTNALHDVWGSGAGDVYAVGQNGTILHGQP